MKLVLRKYHCMGNDYLVYDTGKNAMELTESRIRRLCHRNFGIGSDGILAGPFADGGKRYMRILNPDGSEVGKSGNGAAIFARYLLDAGYINRAREKETEFTVLGGKMRAIYLDESGARQQIAMGRMSFWSDEIPVTGPRREMVDETMVFGKLPYKTTCVAVGNPHCVIWMEEISREEVCRIGAVSETAACFPEKVNTLLLHVVDRKNIEIEIYERGAGYTLASGTSACAAAGAALKMGLVDRKMMVHMPGGQLEVEIGEDGTAYMTVEVKSVGEIILDDGFVEELERI